MTVAYSTADHPRRKPARSTRAETPIRPDSKLSKPNPEFPMYAPGSGQGTE
jgi:hypothetical protein